MEKKKKRASALTTSELDRVSGGNPYGGLVGAGTGGLATAGVAALKAPSVKTAAPAAKKATPRSRSYRPGVLSSGGYAAVPDGRGGIMVAGPDFDWDAYAKSDAYK